MMVSINRITSLEYQGVYTLAGNIFIIELSLNYYLLHDPAL
jgi:hypothetical protein